jgi:hypothetical protein
MRQVGARWSVTSGPSSSSFGTSGAGRRSEQADLRAEVDLLGLQAGAEAVAGDGRRRLRRSRTCWTDDGAPGGAGPPAGHGVVVCVLGGFVLVGTDWAVPAAPQARAAVDDWFATIDVTGFELVDVEERIVDSMVGRHDPPSATELPYERPSVPSRRSDVDLPGRPTCSPASSHGPPGQQTRQPLRRPTSRTADSSQAGRR